jgi:hypothetical protein
MSRSETNSRRRVLLLVLALALVLQPHLLPVAQFGSPDYVYQRTPLTVSDGTYDWESGTAAAPWHGIACLEDPEDRRLCQVEQALVDESLTVTPSTRYDAGAAPYVALSDGVYRRDHTETSSGRTYRLERVALSTAVASVAVSPDRVSSSLREAARGGRSVRHERIDETYVVRDGGDLYLITLTEVDRPPFGPVPVPQFLSAVGSVVGAALFASLGRDATVVLSGE